MPIRSPLIVIVFSLILVSLYPRSAGAHHSWVSEYDANKPVVVKGLVTKVEWTNPHVHIYLDSTDDSGKVSPRNFEMASVLSLERGGWSRRSVSAGDIITMEGFEGRAGAGRAIASAVNTNDGQSLFVDKPRD